MSTVTKIAPSAPAAPVAGTIDLGRATGLPQFDGAAMLGYQEGHRFQQLVPPRRDGHRYSPEFIQEFASWFNRPGENGFWINGPTGAGKTTGVEGLMAHGNVPTVKVRCTPDLTSMDLIASPSLEDGEKGTVSTYVLGPVARAFKHGFTLILDEAPWLAPSVGTSLMEVIRGDSLYVEITGEIILRHPRFRLVATSNDWGRGKGAARFSSSFEQNAALLNRFWKFQMEYPEKEVEVEIITTSVEGMTAQVAEMMVSVARDVRALTDSGDSQSLEVDFSTRTLLAWAEITVRMSAMASNPVLRGLDAAILRSCDEAEKELIMRIVEQYFGS